HAAGRAVPADVEDIAHLDAGGDQRVAGCLDVGDDQVRRGGTGRGGRERGAELDRAPGAVRGELNEDGRRDVQPPAEAAVEPLGAVDIRDRDDDHLDLHVYVLDAADARVAAVGLGSSHGGGLPRAVSETTIALRALRRARDKPWSRPAGVSLRRCSRAARRAALLLPNHFHIATSVLTGR